MNPLEVRQSRLIAALVAMQVAIGIGLSRSGVRFDGFLDVHRTLYGDSVPLGIAIVDQVASLLVAIVVAVIIVRAWKPGVSVGSVARVMGVARLPLLLFAPILLALPVPAALAAMTMSASTRIVPPATVVLAGVAAVGSFVCAIVLLVRGLRRITGVLGWPLSGLTVVTVVFVEGAGKLVIAVLAR